MNAEIKTHTGRCYCGEVEIAVSGQPVGMGYCHCESCRHWSAGPVNAFTLWAPEALKVTRGAASIGTYNQTPISYRKWCSNCGGHLFTQHPTMGLVDVYAAMIPQMRFEPELHVNYQETVLHISDGKPKLKDGKYVPRSASPEILGYPCKLYRNCGGGKFEDVTEKVGLNVSLFGMGVTVAPTSAAR